MLDYLDTLRKKPTHVRMQITYVTTSVLFAVIALVWWGSWTAKDSMRQNDIIAEQSPVNVVAGALSGMRDETVSSWRDTMASLEGLASSSENIATVGETGESSLNGSNESVLTGTEGIE